MNTNISLASCNGISYYAYVTNEARNEVKAEKNSLSLGPVVLISLPGSIKIEAVNNTTTLRDGGLTYSGGNMKPCECGATGAYDYTDANGDYSLCQECYDVAERQQQETDAEEMGDMGREDF